MLKGEREFRARLAAIRLMGQPIARKWAKTTTESAKRRVPVRTGRLKRSIRTRVTSARGAIVVGNFTAAFVDAGTREHIERPKRKRGPRAALRYGNGPRFARKVVHPRTRARPFKKAAAQDGLRANPMAAVVIKLWNDAA